MVRSTTDLAIWLATLLVVGIFPFATGFFAPTLLSQYRLRVSPLSLLSSSNSVNDGILFENHGISDRDARIMTPFTALLTAMLGPNAALAVSPVGGISFDSSVKRYFPGAMQNSDISLLVLAALRERNYKRDNVLFGTSLCSDEINESPDSLLAGLSKNFVDVKRGGVFKLGGLGGVPFVGVSGMGAFVSHCPENGKLLILFGPHVGISQEGVVGKVERIGQTKVSTSCGAAVGAYKAIVAQNKGGNNGFDMQEEFIIEMLEKRIGNVNRKELKGGDDESVAFVTTQMFNLISELLRAQVDTISSKEGFWGRVSEITLLGGIVINRGHGVGTPGGQDYFQPLLLKSISAKGEVDLYRKVFINRNQPAASSEEFQASLQKYFPGALQNSQITLRVLAAMRKRDYLKDNVLFGSSLCSDEINYGPQSLFADLSKVMVNDQNGGVFNLGGLGGLPHVGMSGFGAFVSHCPVEGKLFILFGPHVGISQDGKIGKVERMGQSKVTSSCGAVVGAYKAILGQAPPGKLGMDIEEDFIIKGLKDRFGWMASKRVMGDEAETISFVTYEMYEMAYELLRAQIDATTAKIGFWQKVSEITLLGGIVINRGQTGPVTSQDYFQPLMLKSLTSKSEINLFPKVFADLKIPCDCKLL